jgi:hypothetical protein
MLCLVPGSSGIAHSAADHYREVHLVGELTDQPERLLGDFSRVAEARFRT